MSKKINYVTKIADENSGFSKEELNSILQELGIRNHIYIQFLENAGKKSNVLELKFKNAEEYLNFQNEFRNLLLQARNLDLEPHDLVCFDTTVDSFRNTYYYFIKINEKHGDPTISYYSPGEVPISANFRDERTKEIGLVCLETRFTQTINSKTELKFGTSFWKKLWSYTLLVLLFPLWLPFLIYISVKARP